jgi:hypothetical protein
MYLISSAFSLNQVYELRKQNATNWARKVFTIALQKTVLCFSDFDEIES